MNSSGYVDLQINGKMGVDFSDPKLTEDMFVRRGCQKALTQKKQRFLL